MSHTPGEFFYDSPILHINAAWNFIVSSGFVTCFNQRDDCIDEKG